MDLVFEHESKKYYMKSRGHFTQTEWDLAKNTATPNDPGEFNLTILGIQGIIPDSSFRVENYSENTYVNEIIDFLLDPLVTFLLIFVMLTVIILLIYRLLKKPKGA
jgi:hypothetical protein